MSKDPRLPSFVDSNLSSQCPRLNSQTKASGKTNILPHCTFCMYSWLCVSGHACLCRYTWRPELTSGVFLNCFDPFSSEQFPNWTQSSLGLASQPPSGISCFFLWSLGLQVATFPWHLGSRDPNSGSHMFMTSVLSTEPSSLSPLSLCFYLSWRKSIRTASNFGSKCFDSLCTNSLDRYTIMFIITFSYYLEGILPYRVLLTLIRKIPAVILILWRYFAFVYCFSYTVTQLVAICSFWGSIKGVIESCKTTNWQFTVYSLW